MNERRSLHPFYVVVGIGGVIRGFIPLILIALLRGFDWSELLKWYWLAGGAAVLALLLVFPYLQWRKFGFWLENDRIVIRQGLLFREEKTIYYSRIHSVNVEQPLLQRLLGIAQLKIETPGGNKKADGILHALSMKEAAAIREQLRNFAETGRKEKPAEIGDMSGSGYEASASGIPGEDTVAAVAGRSEAERLSDSSVEAVSDLTNGSAENVFQTPREANTESGVTLTAGQLFQAAATSLNFGLAIAFIAGVYSFADDFINLLLPDHFFERVVEDSASLMPNTLFISAIVLFVIVLAWGLSIVLYVLKYSGFTIHRDRGQVSLSYGLLEKKTVLFDPKNVQAVIVTESLLRQPFGYAEVKLQVVTSDKQEQLMLHPFLKASAIQPLLDSFVPGMSTNGNEPLERSPRRALIYYLRIPFIFAVIVGAACIGIFGAIGAWSLLLIPLVLLWRLACHRSAGLLLREGQLTLRRRVLHRHTYYIRKARIVTMEVKRSRAQRRKELISVSVHALGSAMDFGVACMEERDVNPVWRWYSRSQV